MLEFILFLCAWRRGWKAVALLPLAAAVVVASIMSNAGVSFTEPSFGALLPDLLATAVLGLMCAIPPAAKTPAVMPEEDCAVQ